MWFATGDGLNKYDGASFKIYHHDPGDSTSLGSDDLTCVLEDSKGRFWLGTRNHGLDLFDRENNIFHHIRHRGKNSIRSDNILGIVDDKRGTLWIRTKQGIDRLNVSRISPKTKSVCKPSSFPALQFSFTPIHMDAAQEDIDTLPRIRSLGDYSIKIFKRLDPICHPYITRFRQRMLRLPFLTCCAGRHSSVNNIYIRRK